MILFEVLVDHILLLVIDYFLRKRPIFKLNQKVDDEEKNVDD
jgi:hypothetical protein